MSLHIFKYFLYIFSLSWGIPNAIKCKYPLQSLAVYIKAGLNPLLENEPLLPLPPPPPDVQNPTLNPCSKILKSLWSKIHYERMLA